MHDHHAQSNVDPNFNTLHPVGFYSPDPGGKPPNIVLSRTADTVTVYQPANEMILTFDATEWIDITAMQTRCLDVATGPRYTRGGPMEDMRDSLLSGYQRSMAQALDIAIHIEEHVHHALKLLADEEETPPAPR